MNILIICVGKVREKFFTAGINEYLKRLKAYAKVEIKEVKDESFTEPLSEKNAQAVMEKEADRILAAIPDRYYVIALDRKGKQLSSRELAALLEERGLYGQGNIALIIGGALGLAESVINRSDYILSFSKMTFPHQLMRLILVEQVYRAMTIMRNEKYHK
ncbi:MAG: 23S rRNA (pseudouridine(1915)-N(3))-methyltransferase RlmH [Candidatus Wallacebacter cryptica]|jgi:23S rRNA (pseudouridine1915-N3)-methyltransferase|nr:23S rRNA (pseudouridine(1915)-N(3))-methyltransferase RlmH [Bacillota bacterium]